MRTACTSASVTCPRAHHLGREAHRGIGLRVQRTALAVGCDLGLAQLRQVPAQEAVGRQAIAAVVELGDGQRNALARGGRQAALGQSAGHAEAALQRGRAVGDEAEQVRHATELLLHCIEMGAGRHGGGVDGGGDGKAGHGAGLQGLAMPVHSGDETVDIPEQDN
jgi:hypothetical protein